MSIAIESLNGAKPMSMRGLHVEMDQLGDVASDLATFKSRAQNVAAALVTDPLGERCGKGPSTNRLPLCAQRRVLIILGWLANSDYEKKSIGDRGKNAIRRLQKALGVTSDGSWGSGTQKAFERVLKDSVGAVDASATVKAADAKGGGGGGGKGDGGGNGAKDDDVVADEKKGGGFLLAGIGATAIFAGVAAWWMGKNKGSNLQGADWEHIKEAKRLLNVARGAINKKNYTGASLLSMRAEQEIGWVRSSEERDGLEVELKRLNRDLR